MNLDAIIEEGKRKGLIIRRVRGVVQIRTPNGDIYNPVDTTDLRHYVETFKPGRSASGTPVDVDDVANFNQIIDRSPRA